MPIEHGEICEISELLNDPALQNRSVRVSGRLTRYDVAQDIAILSSEDHHVFVETRLLGSRELEIGSKYQIIGESHTNWQNGKEQGDHVRLLARVCRNVDGIDDALFQKSLMIRRRFIKQDCPNRSQLRASQRISTPSQ